MKITEDGVHFRSPIDGKKHFLGPKESVRIQESLGADIMFAFDECVSPAATKEYMRASLDKTHRWAKKSLDAKSSSLDAALYGIVQGGSFRDLRKESARTIGSMQFDGFAIGGEFGYDKKTMEKLMGIVVDVLPPERPRHALGVGHPEDFVPLARAGMDSFDCIAPTHYARRGTIFTSRGHLDIRKRPFLKDKKPLDPTCSCGVCQIYTRSYISHLMRASELTGMKLASHHNLHYFNAPASLMRQRIKKGEL